MEQDLLDARGDTNAGFRRSSATQECVRRALLLCGALPLCCGAAVFASANRSAAETRPGESRVQIARSTQSERAYQTQPATGGLTIRAGTLDFLIRVAYGVHPRDIVYEAGLAELVERAELAELDRETLYDVVVIPEDGQQQTAMRQLRSQLETTFSFDTTHERRFVAVRALRRAEGAAPLPPSTSKQRNVVGRSGRFAGDRATMADLARFARTFSQEPVVDETGLTGSYDFVLEWDHASGGNAFVQAFEDLGLELVPTHAEVELLIVRPRASAGADGPESQSGAVGG